MSKSIKEFPLDVQDIVFELLANGAERKFSAKEQQEQKEAHNEIPTKTRRNV